MAKFLIVDDNEQNLYLMQVLLESHGHEVVMARNGAEALEKGRIDPPDIVISDVLMPVMDGFALCRLWKDDERLKHIPLVFYSSSYIDDRDKELALNLGADRYIYKPIEPDELLKILREVLAGKETGQIAAPHEPVVEEVVFYREYNEALIRKLEDKLLELEEANRALERDFSERKQAEEALQKSEERYRTLVENANDIIFRTDSTGVFTFFNPVAVRISGYTQEELIGQNYLALIRPDMSDEASKFFGHQFVKKLANTYYEYPVITKDGKELWIGQNTQLMLKDAQVVGFQAVARDITERKQAEMALRESEEKYRNIFENAVEGIFQSTPDGRFLSVNPALARRYGYESPQEMLECVTDIEQQLYVSPEECKKFKEILKKQGRIEQFEVQHYKKDGDKIWVSIIAHEVCSEKGTLLYHEGTFEDITKRKLAEEEKILLETQLRQAQKMEAIGQLAGGIAHDFNNILTVLIGYCNLLQMKMDTNNPLKGYVDQILTASEKAANLTQSLLTFSRKQVMELKPHDVNTIIRGMGKLLQRLITEDIELELELAATDVTIMADITQIDQVLLNLATNARDAMPKGGKLKIATKRVEFHDEFIRVHGYGEPGKYVLISISDTGMGMDEKTREKIFEPFFTTKEVGKGTGLGLSIVYGIIKQHNGYINVYSEQGEGTTFHIYFPAVDVTVEEGIPGFLDIKGGTETILVAEDNYELRELIREVLNSKGYTVIDVIDGEEAVQKFIEYRDTIALLILDVVMPRKNGIEAYKEIKEVKQDIKVFFMSGYTGDVVLDKGLYEEGFNFISKPLSPNELLHKVRNVLDR